MGNIALHPSNGQKYQIISIRANQDMLLSLLRVSVVGTMVKVTAPNWGDMWMKFNEAWTGV